MSRDLFRSIYRNEAELRLARIVLTLIAVLAGTYLVVIGSSLFWHNPSAFIFASLGELVLALPLFLLFRGRLHASSFILILSALGVVTIITSQEQGIHDIGILAYPGLVVISSLLLTRRDFYIMSFLSLAAVAWLVFGEAAGLVIPQPTTPVSWMDFLVVATIMLVVFLGVDLLAQNVRGSLHQAQHEINQRSLVEEQLRYQSTHDALTGIYNRAYFEAELKRLDQSDHHPVSIIIADLDDLKSVNDRQGHAAGDDQLRCLADLLRHSIRSSDVLARIGGDEFAILLPLADDATLSQVQDRIQSTLAAHNRQHPDQAVRVSIGAATAVDGNLVQAQLLADHLMYEEKNRRKNSN
jgi:diguanylate cyclase (GGDEF)-like protein